MRITVTDIKAKKLKKEKIVMLTAYDYSTARIIDDSNIPVILVGDSLGMVILGYDSTIPVTIDDMLHHTKAVSRGTKKAMVVADLPFMTYHAEIGDAMRNAARFLQEGGAQAIKLEGGEIVAETVKKITDCGIPVMGHIGLTPQFIHQLGGFKTQGKTTETARQLLHDALALEQAGAFAIVLELVPAQLARLITERLQIPTIGIGAGPECDGQVQVVSDILGLFTDFVPKHAKQYARLAETIKEAISNYSQDVCSGNFPTSSHCTFIDENLIQDIFISP